MLLRISHPQQVLQVSDAPTGAEVRGVNTEDHLTLSFLDENGRSNACKKSTTMDCKSIA